MKVTVKSIASAVNRLLDVPSLDQDDARRRKLLNILLLFLLVGTFVSALVSSITLIIGSMPPPPTVSFAGIEIPLFFTSIPVVIVLSAILYAINRYWSGTMAGITFLLLVVVSLFANAPEEVLSSHLILTFAIPVVAASFLLRPYASFVTAGLIGLLIGIIGANLPESSPLAAPLLTLEFIALISWLAARGLENALRNLRILNLELDQRVAQRTGELRAILDSTADGIVVFDTNGKATIANPATERLLGQSPREIAGRDIDELMRDRVNAYDQEVIADILKDKTAHYPSLKVKWDDKMLSMSVAPVHLESGEELGTVAVFRDFTREAEIDRMKSTFVSIASHELRAPLTAILGYTEMLVEGICGPLMPEQRDVARRVLANTNQMLSLSNNLLDQAQIEASTLALSITPCVPADLIQSVHETMEVMAQAKGLKLTSHVDDDVPPSIDGDWQRLLQILVNLTNNAIKFTDEGDVTLRAYMHDPGHWALVVSDTGRGIPEEVREIIFEPFQRGDDSLKGYGGAGLGLSIVRQLVGMMGGEVRLDSEVGKGSTFTVVLPLTMNEASTSR